MEKKLQQQDDWARLAQKQAAINEKISEQEKLQKQQKKEDLEYGLLLRSLFKDLFIGGISL